MFNCTLRSGPRSREFTLPIDPIPLLDKLWFVGNIGFEKYELQVGCVTEYFKSNRNFDRVMEYFVTGEFVETIEDSEWLDLSSEVSVCRVGSSHVGVRMSGCSQCFVYGCVDRATLATFLVRSEPVAL